MKKKKKHIRKLSLLAFQVTTTILYLWCLQKNTDVENQYKKLLYSKDKNQSKKKKLHMFLPFVLFFFFLFSLCHLHVYIFTLMGWQRYSLIICKQSCKIIYLIQQQQHRDKGLVCFVFITIFCF